jgi:hypothetical protein
MAALFRQYFAIIRCRLIETLKCKNDQVVTSIHSKPMRGDPPKGGFRFVTGRTLEGTTPRELLGSSALSVMIRNQGCQYGTKPRSCGKRSRVAEHALLHHSFVKQHVGSS